jgi:hypothetical protein
MKLSQLVDYIHHLDQLSVDQLHALARRNIDALISAMIEHPAVHAVSGTHGVMSAVSGVDDAYGRMHDAVLQLRDRVKHLIEAMQEGYFKESLRWYCHESPWETTDYILNRRLNLDDHSRELLHGRMLHYGDFHYPGLVFRPATMDLLDPLLALDPLYLVDTKPELLQPTLDGFTPVFRRRTRDYVINERLDHVMLEQLPDGQFGYVVIYNFFNYKPLPLICQYLDELWRKTRPGGHVLFTFNDCDRAHGIGLAENSMMCYTPGSLILSHAQKLGFELVNHHQGPADVTWFEIRNPGKLTTIKEQQTLATIVLKSK